MTSRSWLQRVAQLGAGDAHVSPRAELNAQTTALRDTQSAPLVHGKRPGPVCGRRCCSKSSGVLVPDAVSVGARNSGALSDSSAPRARLLAKRLLSDSDCPACWRVRVC